MVISLDIKRAFDSVPFDSLALSLQRLKLPQAYIELIMHVTRRRQTRVFTAYGETEAFNPKCGIEQGECNAPLMWNIFYDPLLTRLQSLNSGYSLSRNPHHTVDISSNTGDSLTDPTITKTHDYLPVPEDLKISNVAFMDDLALVSGETKDMEILLVETESFLDLHGISLNASKTVFSRRIPEEENLMIKNNPIGQFIEDGSSFRYLGVQLSLNSRNKDQLLDLKA